MGETVSYLGHVSIVPSLNQSEYDYLCAVTQPDVDLGGPDAEDQSGRECAWEPCAHGCCLSWDGTEKFHAGQFWMRYLIDHFLRPGAHAAGRGMPKFAGFTFDHRMDGLIVGERSWSRQLFAIRVENNEVREEVLLRGEPLPWESGWNGLHPDDRPWLASEPRRRSSLDDPPPELADLKLAPPPVKRRASRPRATNAERRR